MAAEVNKALIRRFIEDVLNKGNLNACDELVALDFVELDPLPGQEQGRDGLKQVVAMLRSAFPDMVWTITEQVAEDDKVVTRFFWKGTHRGTFFGVPPTGHGVTVPGVVIDRLTGGKMQESRILMDTFSLMQQLGAIPSAAPAE